MTLKKYLNHYKLNVFLTYLLVTVLILAPFKVINAAGPLTALSDTMSNMNDGAVSNHTIQFTTPTGVASGQTIILTFPTGFDVNAGDNLLDYTDIDVTDDTVDVVLAGSPSGATWGVGVTASAITLTNGTTAVAAGSVIAIEVGTNATSVATGDKQIVNQTVAQNNTDPKIVITGSFTDTGTIAVEIITNDQVVVQTTIDPYITFSIGQNTVTLNKSGGGNPDYSNTGYNTGTANTLAANTNASTGYTITYLGDTLKSGVTNSIDAMATKTTSATNTEQFGINLKDNATPNTGTDASGGSGAAASDYNTADSFRFIANAVTTLASVGGPSVTTTFTATYIVNVTQTTEAGAYTTTLTYICTGNF